MTVRVPSWRYFPVALALVLPVLGCIGWTWLHALSTERAEAATAGFAAGAAAAVSIHRRSASAGGCRASTWVAERITRLAVPVLPLAAVWVILPHLMIASGVAPQAVEMGAELVGRLLWFLAVYTALIASAIAFALQVWGQRLVGPTRTSLLLMLLALAGRRHA